MQKNLILEFSDETEYQLLINLLQRLNIKYQEAVTQLFQNTPEENRPKFSFRKSGSLSRFGHRIGKNFSLPDDFNEPLDDLKDYM